MSNQELKPCPFCGGRALFKTVSNAVLHHSAVFSFKIECGDCGAALPGRYSVEFGLTEHGIIAPARDDRNRAAEVWNGRA